MMRRQLRGAVVVLTGASSGIGRATALLFARRGARLVLAARDPYSLEEIADECRERYGAEALPVVTDVRDESSVDALSHIAIDRFGRIDVWVNDAAVYMLGSLEECPTPAIRSLIETNLMGVVYGMRAAMAAFRRQRRGVLINVGSLAGNVSYALAGPYCASKHAVHALTESLRQELGLSEIHAGLVVPGTVDTPLFQHAANYTGREIVPMPPIDDAERAARAIVSMAERPRREIVVGAAPVLLTLVDRALPWLGELVLRALVRSEHLGHQPRTKNVGNLRASREPHATSGGWRGIRRSRPLPGLSRAHRSASRTPPVPVRSARPS